MLSKFFYDKTIVFLALKADSKHIWVSKFIYGGRFDLGFDGSKPFLVAGSSYDLRNETVY